MAAMWKWAGGVAAGAAGLFALKKYFNGGVCTANVDLSGKVAVVTGGNTGIGYHTAAELAKRGATVVLACRDKRRGVEAAKHIQLETGSKKVEFMPLDLADLASVRRFVELFNDGYDRLDLLINNAGVMQTPQMQTADGFEYQLGVNHLGHFLLTNLLLPVIKESGPSRIVVVSSLAHKRGIIYKDDLMLTHSYTPRQAYNQSKLANVLFAMELQRRLDQEGAKVTVNSLHPGVIRTELGRHMVERLPWYGRFLLYILSPLILLCLKDAWHGAQTSLFAAMDPSMEGVGGQYLSDCKVVRAQDLAYDRDLARWLWDESARLTKL